MGLQILFQKPLLHIKVPEGNARSDGRKFLFVKHQYNAFPIQFARVTTVWRRVLCNKTEFGKPATFTMPVIERFPIAGSFLFTPFPGISGEVLRVA